MENILRKFCWYVLLIETPLHVLPKFKLTKKSIISLAVIAVHTFLYKQVQLLRVGIQKWSQIKQLASAAQAQIALSFKQLRLKFTSQQATLLCI